MTDDPSATLAGILEHIRDGAESEITHPDDECGVEAGGFCTPHGALLAVAALEAVLALADEWAALDAGWGQFAGILAAKAEEAGRRTVLVDPRNTSINCHQCGARCVRPQQDTVICAVHGAMDADVNGAINIASRAGLGSGRANAA